MADDEPEQAEAEVDAFKLGVAQTAEDPKTLKKNPPAKSGLEFWEGIGHHNPQKNNKKQ